VADIPMDDPVWLDRIDMGYQWQMLCQASCTGIKEVDFVQYDPRVEEAFRCIIIPFPVEEDRITQMLEESEKFLKELQTKIENRRKISGK
jgi:hypothetical protein